MFLFNMRSFQSTCTCNFEEFVRKLKWKFQIHGRQKKVILVENFLVSQYYCKITQ